MACTSNLPMLATMDISGLKDGDTAGVISLGMEYAAITLQKCDEGYVGKHARCSKF